MTGAVPLDAHPPMITTAPQAAEMEYAKLGRTAATVKLTANAHLEKFAAITTAFLQPAAAMQIVMMAMLQQRIRA